MIVVRHLTVAAFTLTGLTALVLLVTHLALSPPGSDLAKLAVFLVISGGVTMLIGLAATRWRIPGRFGTLRARLVLVPVLTALLALANVAFTSLLMFLSSHDLIPARRLTKLLSGDVGVRCFHIFQVQHLYHPRNGWGGSADERRQPGPEGPYPLQ